MGCFSFMCKECKEPINSTSFQGEMVHLFLLENGKVIQKMSGEYDSYGSVFKDGTQRKDVKHSLRESVAWKQIRPFTDKELEAIKVIGKAHKIWHQVCDLMHKAKYEYIPAKGDSEEFTLKDGTKIKIPKLGTHKETPIKNCGIAAIHMACYKGKLPRTRSNGDGNQGWGKLKAKHANKANKKWKPVSGWSTYGSET